MLKNLIIGFSFVLVACGGSDDGVAELEAMVDKMCACKDRQCFEEYDDRLEATAKKVLSKYKKESDMPEALVERLEKLDDKVEACAEKLRP